MALGSFNVPPAEQGGSRLDLPYPYLHPETVDSLADHSSLTSVQRRRFFTGSVDPLADDGVVIDFADPLVEPLPVPDFNVGRFTLARGRKAYELSNHLGNVLAVVGDYKMRGSGEIGTNSVGNPLETALYEPFVWSMTDYYPFGMEMPERRYSAGDYRYGFNGQEGDDEHLGTGNSYAFRYRVHDARIGRFLSVDPLEGEYPWNSTYAFAENDVVRAIDLEGAEKMRKVETDPDDFWGWKVTVGIANFLGGIWNSMDDAGGAIIQGFDDAYHCRYNHIVGRTEDGLEELEESVVDDFENPAGFGKGLLHDIQDPYLWGYAAGSAGMTYAGGQFRIGSGVAPRPRINLPAKELPKPVKKAVLIVDESQITTAPPLHHVKVFRVQGGTMPNASQMLISIDGNGTVALANKTLNISIGNLEHAKYFLEKRLKTWDSRRPDQRPAIYSFDIPRWLFEMMEEYAIPQKGYRTSNTHRGLAPKIVDPNTPGTSFELPQPWGKWIQENYIKGSGEIIDQ